MPAGDMQFDSSRLPAYRLAKQRQLLAGERPLHQFGEQRLRLQGNDLRAKGEEGPATAARMGPDIEDKIARLDQVRIEPLQGGSPPGLAMVDEQGANKTPASSKSRAHHEHGSFAGEKRCRRRRNRSAERAQRLRARSR